MADNETPEDEQVEQDGAEAPVDSSAEAAADASAEEAVVPPEEDVPDADTEPAAEAEPAEEPAAETAEGVRRKRKRVPRSERRQRAKPKRERPKERAKLVRLPKPDGLRGARQERRGVVVSSGMEKTIVVRVETLKSHPRYKKIIRRSSKLHAHDERNEAKVGDVVRIVETRPRSKTKRWRLAEVLEVAK